ncbi:hypothetical protein BY996DRAFT_3979798 [Phakopsora pachyrhizi]|nr:hypothetical protein BY996DRAFT_3979798 [Phakopsora pachyrhizi]
MLLKEKSGISSLKDTNAILGDANVDGGVKSREMAKVSFYVSNTIGNLKGQQLIDASKDVDEIMSRMVMIANGILSDSPEKQALGLIAIESLEEIKNNFSKFPSNMKILVGEQLHDLQAVKASRLKELDELKQSESLATSGKESVLPKQEETHTGNKASASLIESEFPGFAVLSKGGYKLEPQSAKQIGDNVPKEESQQARI